MSICDPIRSLFSPYIDEEVTLEEKACVEVHVQECALCRKEFEIYRQQDRLVGDLIREKGNLRQFVKSEVERVKMTVCDESKKPYFPVKATEVGRILVVEDNKRYREKIVSVLTREGYDVQSAPNGKDALDILAEQKAFDMAIVDKIMPQMNGLSFLQKAFRTRSYRIAFVIWLTAYGAWEDVFELNKLGIPYLAMDKREFPENFLCRVKEIIDIQIPAPTWEPVNKLQIQVQAKADVLRTSRDKLRTLLDRRVEKKVFLRSQNKSIRFDIPATESEDAYVDQCILFVLAWYYDIKVGRTEIVSARALADEINSHRDLCSMPNLDAKEIEDRMVSIKKRLAEQIRWRFSGSQIVPEIVSRREGTSYCFTPSLEIESSYSAMDLN